MRPQMWIGAGRFGAFLPCPQTPMDVSHTSNSSRTDLLNGGVHIAPKTGHARSYSFQWKGSTDDIQTVQNFYDGLYGDGPYYPIDPSITRNLLPPQWAAPYLSGGRWPTLVRGALPVVTPTPGGVDGLPPFTATYPMPAAIPAFDRRTPRITIPIPPGSTLRLRAWGSVVGSAAIRINLYERDTDAVTVLNLTPTPTGKMISMSGPETSENPALFPSTTLFPSSTLFPSNGVVSSYAGPYYSRAEIWLGKLTGVDSSLTLAGLTAQLNSAYTSWYPGQGTNGLQFDGDGIGVSTYRAWGTGWKLVTAQMTEVGSWM
jgi:hypothetical protein